MMFSQDQINQLFLLLRRLLNQHPAGWEQLKLLENRSSTQSFHNELTPSQTDSKRNKLGLVTVLHILGFMDPNQEILRFLAQTQGLRLVSDQPRPNFVADLPQGILAFAQALSELWVVCLSGPDESTSWDQQRPIIDQCLYALEDLRLMLKALSSPEPLS